MLAQKQIKKPENWQDFEKLCKKLWGEIWDCSASIKRNGRSGQHQKGVDIYGIPKNENEYYGIQCKGKDDYTQSKLTKKEIDREIEKSLHFKPKLKELIFATTSNKDAEIEEYIRELNIKHHIEGKFSVDIFSWEDIVDLLEERRETFNWYNNNCQYKDASDVNVSFSFKETVEIKPIFIRQVDKYRMPKQDPNMRLTLALSQYKQNPHFMGAFFGQSKRKIDYSWCTVPITIKNIGATAIKDYKLYLIFDEDKVEEIDDRFRRFNPGPLFDQVAVMNENINRKKNQEVFESTEFSKVIEFRPLNSILVQDDHITFKIGVKPQNYTNEILLQWILKSRDYKKNGELSIKVNAQIEDKVVWHESEEPKEDKVVIKPKIIEE